MLPAEETFIKHMLRHTVRLMRNAQSYPDDLGVASGLIVQRPGSDDLIVLTAGHNFDRPGPWTLETNVTVDGTTLHVPLRDVQLLVSADVTTGQHQRVDLAWAWIDRSDVRAALAQHPDLAGHQVDLPVYRESLDAAPMADSVYGYASWSRVEIHRATQVLAAQPSFELYMTFSGTRESDGLYQFDLARPHRGHKYYQGASGAPIADETGRIVSLLLEGDIEQNRLFGAPLARFSSVVGLGR